MNYPLVKRDAIPQPAGPRRAIRIAHLVPILLILLLPACSDDRPVDILLVTIDTLRADHIGCYGYKGIETPVMDGLASRGALFTQAVSHHPQTLPSHASMLTGLLPPQHGVRMNFQFRLPPEVPTLPAILRNNGYQTGAVVGALTLDSSYGLARGFDHYDDDIGRGGGNPPVLQRRAKKVTRRAIEWIAGHGKKPFFLWVHYFDPHRPYVPPAPFKEIYHDTPYDGEIAYTDLHLGVLINQIKKLRHDHQTLIVVTSDHGEGLAEHGELTHSYLIYDSVMRIPLIVVPPRGRSHPVRINEQVRAIDIAPTILAYAGLPPLSGSGGRNLRPAIEGKEELPVDLPAYLETYVPYYHHGWSPLLGLRRGGMKLIIAPSRELYDLRKDPGELRNLYDEGDQSRTLTRELARITESFSREGVEQPMPIDEDTEEQLHALGYVAAGGDEPSSVFPLAGGTADPKEMTSVVNALAGAIGLFDEGRYLEAIDSAEAGLKDDPGNVMVLELIAKAQMKAKLYREVKHTYHRLLDLNPKSPKVHNALGIVEQQLGNFEEARRQFERCLEMDPKSYRAANNLARLYSEQQDLERAEELYRQAIRLRPEEPVTHLNLGNVYIRMNRPDLASEQFRQVLRLGGNSQARAKALNNLRYLAERKERP